MSKTLGKRKEPPASCEDDDEEEKDVAHEQVAKPGFTDSAMTEVHTNVASFLLTDPCNIKDFHKFMQDDDQCMEDWPHSKSLLKHFAGTCVHAMELGYPPANGKQQKKKKFVPGKGLLIGTGADGAMDVQIDRRFTNDSSEPCGATVKIDIVEYTESPVEKKAKTFHSSSSLASSSSSSGRLSSDLALVKKTADKHQASQHKDDDAKSDEKKKELQAFADAMREFAAELPGTINAFIGNDMEIDHPNSVMEVVEEAVLQAARDAQGVLEKIIDKFAPQKTN